MSDYGDYEDEWDDEDLWWEDVENLADTLVSTAYGHEPPYNPETYDAYDSDFEELEDDGDDEYFEGPLPDPDPSMILPHAYPQHPHSNANITTITPTITPSSLPPKDLAKPYRIKPSEQRFKEAMVGKKFYGDDTVRIRILSKGGVDGAGGVRKRRKIGEQGIPMKVGGKRSALGGSMRVDVISFGSDSASTTEDDEEESGYRSDGPIVLALEEGEDDEGLRTKITQVEIRDGGKKGLAGGGGRGDGKISHRTIGTPKAVVPPHLTPPPLGLQEKKEDSSRSRKRKNTPLKE